MAFEALIDGGGVVTEPYGCWQPYQPNCWGCQANPGIDIAPLTPGDGQILRALGYGTCVAVGTPAWAGPQCVVIASGDVLILYAHCSLALVSVGQQVGPGQSVARIGCLVGPGGTCTGPHVHYQINPAGQPDFAGQYCSGIDPGPYLSSWPGQAPAPPTPPPPSAPTPPPAPEQVSPVQGVGLGALVALTGVALGGYLARDSYRKLKIKGSGLRL